MVGTGRCGTVYTAALLTACGIPFGHEAVFRPRGIERRWGLAGDASYLAVPWLPFYSGLVLHQVRHPVAVVRSLVGSGFFGELAPHSKYRAPVDRLVAPTGDPVRDAVRYTVAWNERCERHAAIRYRIEDIDAVLGTLVALIDPSRLEAVPDALARVPRGMNTRARAREIAGVDDLPAGPDREALARMVTRYGYDLSG